MTSPRIDPKRERLAARRQLRELVTQAERAASVPVGRYDGSTAFERREPISLHAPTWGGRRIG